MQYILCGSSTAIQLKLQILLKLIRCTVNQKDFF